jgi:hypothetical protein
VLNTFRDGELPTELLLNGEKPAITAATLRKYARRLRDKHKLN